MDPSKFRQIAHRTRTEAMFERMPKKRPQQNKKMSWSRKAEKRHRDRRWFHLSRSGSALVVYRSLFGFRLPKHFSFPTHRRCKRATGPLRGRIANKHLRRLAGITSVTDRMTFRYETKRGYFHMRREVLHRRHHV